MTDFHDEHFEHVETPGEPPGKGHKANSHAKSEDKLELPPLDRSDRDRLKWESYVGRTPPPPAFMVEGIMPKGAVTGLFGSDGLGKTLFGQQALTTMGAGFDLFGHKVIERGGTLGWFCEEPEPVLAYRQDAINRRLGLSFADLDNLGVEIRARLGMDNLLVRMVKSACEPTPAFDALRTYCVKQKVKTLWLDHILHIVGGDITRPEEVTKMVAVLAGLAADIDGAVVIAGHVAKVEGSQFLGSVMFSAMVRSRLWLRRPSTEELVGYPSEGRCDLRALELAKANHAGLTQVMLRWLDGAFIQADGGDSVADRVQHERRAEAVFIRALRELDQRQRSVDVKGLYAAHNTMVDHGLNEGLAAIDLQNAMKRLIKSKRVKPSILKPWKRDRKDVRGLALNEDAP